MGKEGGGDEEGRRKTGDKRQVTVGGRLKGGGRRGEGGRREAGDVVRGNKGSPPNLLKCTQHIFVASHDNKYLKKNSRHRVMHRFFASASMNQ